MSKIIVREYDNSNTGIASSNNFTVALAGFIGDNADNSIWDENGCAEFVSQSDFATKVGLVGVSAGGSSTAGDVSALVTVNNTSLVSGLDLYKTSLLDRKLILPTSDKSAEYTTALNLKKDDSYGILYEEATSADNSNNSEKYYLFTYEKTNAVTGYGVMQIDNAWYKLSPVTSILSLLSYADQTTTPVQYVDLKKELVLVSDLSKLGTNEGAFKHKGNQIAYELLGLGFPIIYKKMDSSTTQDAFSRASFWNCFRDKSLYNFRYIMTGYALDDSVNQAACNCIANIVSFDNNTTLENADTLDVNTGRGDCTALCDFCEGNIVEQTNIAGVVSKTANAVAGLTGNKFTAIFGPRVIYGGMSEAEVKPFGSDADDDTNSVRTFPASFHYLACLANALQNYNEWYAVAGTTRGIAARTVTGTTIKYGDIANNTLAPRTKLTIGDSSITKAVNLVVYDRGAYVLKGNRTAMTLNDSGLKYSHYLNIRQLCTTIKKRLYAICSQLAFDPNSDLLWQNFLSAIKPTLEAMKADQGINGYKITKVSTATKGVLKAIIRIVPIEAVEDFDISLTLEDSLDGIAISADEAE